MPGDESPQSISQKEMELWTRVIVKRRDEWKALPRNELLNIIHGAWRSEGSPPSIEDPCEQTEWLLNAHFHRSIDRKIPPNKRRASWECVNVLLNRLDEATNTKINREKRPLNMELSVEKGCSEQVNTRIQTLQSSQAAASSSPARAIVADAPAGRQIEQRSIQISKIAPPAHQAPAVVIANPELSGTAARDPPLNSVSNQQITPNPLSAAKENASQRQQTPLQGQKSPPKTQQAQPRKASSRVHLENNATSVLERLPSPVKTASPTQATTRKPYANGHTAPGEIMGSHISSRIAPVEVSSAAHQKTNAHPPRAASPSQFFPPVSVTFAADPQKFTAALEPRSNMKLTFSPMTLPSQESSRTIERLRTWDPYWKIEHTIALTQTAKVDKVDKLRFGPRPLQATESNVALDRRFAGLVRDWGKPHKRSYEQGEMRVLVRMLPLKPVQKKRPRADTHLWPIGTFVQFKGMPIQIEQRRQQSHDPKEWKYMSHMLDLTTRIDHPMSSFKLQLCFLDNEPYVLSVALCSYVSPDTLYRTAMNEWVEMLSMDEAKAKASRTANQQTVVLEDDIETAEMNSFVFSLTCPISHQIMVTPVRGKDCKHWQCFDLRNFLETNKDVTGTRWECPVCSSIVSCHDLQHCPLTASSLTEFKDQAQPHRDRVQFFANGAYTLLGEAKKRYAKKRPTTAEEDESDNKRARTDGFIPALSSPEVIDLL